MTSTPRCTRGSWPDTASRVPRPERDDYALIHFGPSWVPRSLPLRLRPRWLRWLFAYKLYPTTFRPLLDALKDGMEDAGALLATDRIVR